MKNLLKTAVTVGLVVICLVAGINRPVEAKDLNVDTIIFDPVSDGGLYLNVHDTQTLPQWRFHFGSYYDYGHEPLELRNSVTNQRRGVVDDLIMGHFQAGLGFYEYKNFGFAAGFSVPVIFYQTFYNPNVTTPAKETKAGIGDIRLETKFRILDNERYPVGIAVIPFMTFPLGDRDYFLGNGKVTGGAKLAVEGNISNRVWIAMNWGYQFMPGSTQYYANNADAVIDDILSFGLGVHGKINDIWALIAELHGETVMDNAFSSLRQTPIEAVGGVRMTPRFRGHLQGLSFTVAGGGGLTKGIGNPDFHVIAGINYRKPRIVDLAEPGPAKVEVEEKIIIAQKIHFEFDRSVIRPISYPILNDVAALLKRSPHIAKVRVEGHTDWIGSDAYNQGLSERRARSVVNYLVKNGIASDRLTSVGYGESKPIADNRTTEGRAKNRRTEFTVIGKN